MQTPEESFMCVLKRECWSRSIDARLIVKSTSLLLSRLWYICLRCVLLGARGKLHACGEAGEPWRWRTTHNETPPVTLFCFALCDAGSRGELHVRGEYGERWRWRRTRSETPPVTLFCFALCAARSPRRASRLWWSWRAWGTRRAWTPPASTPRSPSCPATTSGGWCSSSPAPGQPQPCAVLLSLSLI